MPFIPRQFLEILDDMITHVRTHTDLTDFNRGSVIRTILEAASLEDDEQYYQMIQILNDFSYKTASGTELDRRAKDFSLTRNGATHSTGEIIVMNDNLERSYMLGNGTGVVPAGATTLVVEDISVYPTGGFPYTVRLGEGTSVEEDVSVTSVSVATSTLSLGLPNPAALNDHVGLNHASLSSVTDEYYLDAARAAVVSGGGSNSIPLGTVCTAPAVGDLAEVSFFSTTSGTVADGDYKSGLVAVRSQYPGPTAVIGPKRISSFDSAPFTGALVTNPEATGGGAEAESDAKFAERIANVLHTMSKGTRNAVRSRMLNVTDPATGQKVKRVSILEHFVNDTTFPGDGRFLAYIDDGTGTFSGTTQAQPICTPSAPISATSNTFDAISAEYDDFPDEDGWLLFDDSVESDEEILQYTTFGKTSPYTVALSGATGSLHNPTSVIIRLLDSIDMDTIANKRFYNIEHVAVVTDTDGDTPTMNLIVQDWNGTVYTYLRKTVYDPGLGNFTAADYLFHPGIGQIEFIPGKQPSVGSRIFAYYTRYTGLTREAQRQLDGDFALPSTYPGVRATGVRALAIPAVGQLLNVSIKLSILEGFDRSTLLEVADRVVRQYINSIDPGGEFVINEMVERVMGITGMYDITVIAPTSNQVFSSHVVPAVGTITVV